MTVMAPVSSKKMDSAASGSWENYHMLGGHMHITTFLSNFTKMVSKIFYICIRILMLGFWIMVVYYIEETVNLMITMHKQLNITFDPKHSTGTEDVPSS
jgi:TRAP-type C4-dicarboxylate transport system permease small subunit